MPTSNAPPAAPRPAPGRPKDPVKRAAILDAAKCMFSTHGFDGVSMDQIAAQAGVSKLTVYSHFGDKDTLFVEVIEHYCSQQVPPALFSPSPGTPLEARLRDIGRAVHALLVSPEAVSGYRLMCASRHRDCDLPALFWNAGAGHLQAELAALLARRAAAGELDLDDPARAAGQFFALLRGDLHPRLVLGCDEPHDAGHGAYDTHVDACVDLFIRAYARQPERGAGGRPAR